MNDRDRREIFDDALSQIAKREKVVIFFHFIVRLVNRKKSITGA